MAALAADCEPRTAGTPACASTGRPAVRWVAVIIVPLTGACTGESSSSTSMAIPSVSAASSTSSVCSTATEAAVAVSVGAALVSRLVVGGSGFATSKKRPPLRSRRAVATLGGGRVLDAGRPRAEAPVGGRRGALLRSLSAGDEKALADLFLLEAGPAGLTAARLGARLGIVSAAAANLLETLARLGPGAADHARALRARVRRVGRSPTAPPRSSRSAGRPARSRSRSRAGEFAGRLARGLSPAARDGWLATLAAGKRPSHSTATGSSRPARRPPTSRARPRPSRRGSRSSTGRRASSRPGPSTPRSSSGRSRRSSRASSRTS